MERKELRAYILETGNPYFGDSKMPVIKLTKTQIVCEHQRFRRPEKLEDGVQVYRYPKARFNLCHYTYKEESK